MRRDASQRTCGGLRSGRAGPRSGHGASASSRAGLRVPGYRGTRPQRPRPFTGSPVRRGRDRSQVHRFTGAETVHEFTRS
eukprot:3573903-Alexandrium_andersonii.AAC.1